MGIVFIGICCIDYRSGNWKIFCVRKGATSFGLLQVMPVRNISAWMTFRIKRGKLQLGVRGFSVASGTESVDTRPRNDKKRWVSFGMLE